MSWIRRIEQPESSGYLRTLHDRLEGPGGRVDNVTRAHGLRPHTREARLAPYTSAT